MHLRSIDSIDGHDMLCTPITLKITESDTFNRVDHRFYWKWVIALETTISLVSEVSNTNSVIVQLVLRI